ncbi:MAG TPA: hypothetical protein PLT66_05725 [Bacillota bacterium]|nr:hypothetical protein [Bacillota bacterium]
MNINWKDVGIRAFKTFWQTAIPIVTAALAGVDYSGEGDAVKTALIGAVITAAAAGLSAIYNGMVKPLYANTQQTDDTGGEDA